MKKIIITTILFMCLLMLEAQQNTKYNSYNYMPFLNQVAYNSDSTKVELGIVSRAQWIGIDGAPYSSAIYAQTRTLFNLGLGGILETDKIGPVRRTRLNLNLSYVIPFTKNKKNNLAIGLRGGFNMQTIHLKTESELNDPFLINNQGSKINPDISTGLYIFGDRYRIGFSAMDLINKGGYPLSKIHYNFSAGYDAKLTEAFDLKPFVQTQITTGAPASIDLGLGVSYKGKFEFGATYSIKDAIGAYSIVQVKDLVELGVFYEYSLTPIKSANVGTLEGALRFNINKKKFKNLDTETLDSIFITKTDTIYISEPTSTNENLKLRDSDGDGFSDNIDECPLKEGIINGCPDYDKDGVPDKDDVCPTIPGLIGNNGCPLLDQDGDGVPDINDNCPKTPGLLSNFGCPLVDEQDQEIVNLAFDNLEFETGKTVIRTSSYYSLEKLATILKKNPNYLLTVSGHTDNVGTEISNLDLSRGRAEAIAEFMYTKGIDYTRIKVSFYGEMKPIATNETEAGRQKNRRVEMNITFE